LQVVRSGLLQEVQQDFGLENAQIATYDSPFSAFYGRQHPGNQPATDKSISAFGQSFVFLNLDNG
jgi:hypothetical protein